MSRTIRRTRAKKHNKSGRSNFEQDWTYNWTYDAEGLWYRQPLEGKEFEQAYWRFHGDRLKFWGNSTFGRFEAEHSCRQKNREEIARYLKDEDYEIMVHEPRCLSWDR